MQTVVPLVIDHLERTVQVYEQILQTERAKQRAIVASEIDALQEIVAREEVLVAQAAGLEDERRRITSQIATLQPDLGPNPRLRQLIESLEGPGRDALAKTHDHLLSLASEISDVNRTNYHLLRTSLDYLRECLDSVFGTPDEPDTYTPDGRHGTPGHEATCVDQLL